MKVLTPPTTNAPAWRILGINSTIDAQTVKAIITGHEPHAIFPEVQLASTHNDAGREVLRILQDTLPLQFQGITQGDTITVIDIPGRDNPT
jgi:hypothetical protein